MSGFPPSLFFFRYKLNKSKRLTKNLSTKFIGKIFFATLFQNPATKAG